MVFVYFSIIRFTGKSTP